MKFCKFGVLVILEHTVLHFVSIKFWLFHNSFGEGKIIGEKVTWIWYTTITDGMEVNIQVESFLAGVLDEADNCPLHSNTNQLNNDEDTLGDVCDDDDDNDGRTWSHCIYNIQILFVQNDDFFK